MLQLNLPSHNFRIKKEKDKYFIFDSQRKRFVSLTPEEWVRQHFIRFLLDVKGYPAASLAVEKQLKINGMNKRCDAILYNKMAEPILIIECKAPTVLITQQTFDQVAVYNTKLKVDYFMISNGLEHYCCKVNVENSKYEFYPEIPDYSTLKLQ